MTSESNTQPEPSSAQDVPHGGEPSHTDSHIHSSPEGGKCQCCASAGDIAATLKDIREFMRSAMKSLDIPVPEGDDVEIDLDFLKPKDSMYNEETALDFWRKRITTRELLDSLCNCVLGVFTGDCARFVDPGISPVMLVCDGNSNIGPLVWNTFGFRDVANGEELFELIRKKWPEDLALPENEISIEFRPPFKELFHWDLMPASASAMLMQWSYDQGGYPTWPILEDYGNIKSNRFRVVRMTRILRFGKS
jgi:hypothetical protein